MADKKLNEVSQLTDFDYALVVKGNDVAKVTKQQLATILGGLLPLVSENNNGLMPMEQFFDRDVNPIEDYNTFTWNGIRKTTKSTLNSPFSDGDGQNAVIFIGTNDIQKIGFQATYSGQLIKIRLYWVGSWGKWQTFSLT